MCLNHCARHRPLSRGGRGIPCSTWLPGRLGLLSAGVPLPSGSPFAQTQSEPEREGGEGGVGEGREGEKEG